VTGTEGTAAAPSAVDRFFADVRSIGLNDRRDLSLSDDEIHALVSDIALSAEFLRKFDSFTQDDDLKALVVEMLRRLGAEEKRESQRCEANIATVDRYGGRMSGAAVVGGVGALLYGAVAAGAVAVAGPIALVACGVGGVVACIWGRARLGEAQREAMSRQDAYERFVQAPERKLDRKTTGEERK
jgi:hypothetical protein